MRQNSCFFPSVLQLSWENIPYQPAITSNILERNSKDSTWASHQVNPPQNHRSEYLDRGRQTHHRTREDESNSSLNQLCYIISCSCLPLFVDELTRSEAFEVMKLVTGFGIKMQVSLTPYSSKIYSITLCQITRIIIITCSKCSHRGMFKVLWTHNIGGIMEGLKCFLKKVTSDLTFEGSTGGFLMVEFQALCCLNRKESVVLGLSSAALPLPDPHP